MKWVICALLFATLTLGVQQAGHAQQGSAPELTGADADAVVLDRQLIMKQLEADSDALGSIYSATAKVAVLAPRLRSLARGAKDAQKAFEVKALGGSAKPEIWSDGEEFARMMKVFVEKSDEMAKVGEAGNLSAAGDMMAAALPCKQCHDLYRRK